MIQNNPPLPFPSLPPNTLPGSPGFSKAKKQGQGAQKVGDFLLYYNFKSYFDTIYSACSPHARTLFNPRCRRAYLAGWAGLAGSSCQISWFTGQGATAVFGRRIAIWCIYIDIDIDIYRI